MLQKISDFINNNKVASWIIRNGLLLGMLAIIIISGFVTTKIVELLIVLWSLVASVNLLTNFTLYTLSDFKISRDALRGVNDGDLKISPIIQKTYLDFIGRVFGWICFLAGVVMWLIYSDIL